MSNDQIATFLFSALLASESLLMSAFGNLYSAYLRGIAERVGGLILLIRRLCYLIAFTICIISCTNLVIIGSIAGKIDGVVYDIHYVLYAIVLLICVPPVILSFRMYKDGSA